MKIFFSKLEFLFSNSFNIFKKKKRFERKKNWERKRILQRKIWISFFFFFSLFFCSLSLMASLYGNAMTWQGRGKEREKERRIEELEFVDSFCFFISFFFDSTFFSWWILLGGKKREFFDLRIFIWFFDWNFSHFKFFSNQKLWVPWYLEDKLGSELQLSTDGAWLRILLSFSRIEKNSNDFSNRNDFFPCWRIRPSQIHWFKDGKRKFGGDSMSFSVDEWSFD